MAHDSPPTSPIFTFAEEDSILDEQVPDFLANMEDDGLFDSRPHTPNKSAPPQESIPATAKSTGSKSDKSAKRMQVFGDAMSLASYARQQGQTPEEILSRVNVPDSEEDEQSFQGFDPANDSPFELSFGTNADFQDVRKHTEYSLAEDSYNSQQPPVVHRTVEFVLPDEDGSEEYDGSYEDDGDPQPALDEDVDYESKLETVQESRDLEEADEITPTGRPFQGKKPPHQQTLADDEENYLPRTEEERQRYIKNGFLEPDGKEVDPHPFTTETEEGQATFKKKSSKIEIVEYPMPPDVKDHYKESDVTDWWKEDLYQRFPERDPFVGDPKDMTEKRRHQVIDELRKENFDLKLRIYYEERAFSITPKDLAHIETQRWLYQKQFEKLRVAHASMEREHQKLQNEITVLSKEGATRANEKEKELARSLEDERKKLRSVTDELTKAQHQISQLNRSHVAGEEELGKRLGKESAKLKETLDKLKKAQDQIEQLERAKAKREAESEKRHEEDARKLREAQNKLQKTQEQVVQLEKAAVLKENEFNKKLEEERRVAREAVQKAERARKESEKSDRQNVGKKEEELKLKLTKESQKSKDAMSKLDEVQEKLVQAEKSKRAAQVKEAELTKTLEKDHEKIRELSIKLTKAQEQAEQIEKARGLKEADLVKKLEAKEQKLKELQGKPDTPQRSLKASEEDETKLDARLARETKKAKDAEAKAEKLKSDYAQLEEAKAKAQEEIVSLRHELVKIKKTPSVPNATVDKLRKDLETLRKAQQEQEKLHLAETARLLEQLEKKESAKPRQSISSGTTTPRHRAPSVSNSSLATTDKEPGRKRMSSLTKDDTTRSSVVSDTSRKRAPSVANDASRRSSVTTNVPATPLMEKLKHEIEELKKTRRERDREHDLTVISLKKELSAKEKELQSKIARISELDRQLHTTTTRTESKDGKLAELSREVQKLTSELRNAQEEKQGLESTIAELKNKQQHLLASQSQLKDATVKVSELTRSIEVFHTQISEFKTKLKAEVVAHDSTKQTLQAARDELQEHKLRGSNNDENLKKELLARAETEKKLGSLQEQVKELASNYENALNYSRRLDEQLEKSKAQLVVKENEIAKGSEKTASLSAQIASMRAELDGKEQRLQQHVRESSAEFLVLRGELDAKEQQLQTLSKNAVDVANLRNALDAKEQKIHQLTRDLTQVAQLQTEVTIKEHKLQQLTHDLTSVAVLRAELENKDKQLQLLGRDASQIPVLRSELDAKERKLQNIMHELDIKERKVEELSRNSAEVTKLHLELTEKEHKIDYLMRELATKGSSSGQQQTVIATLRAEMELKEQRLQQALRDSAANMASIRAEQESNEAKWHHQIRESTNLLLAAKTELEAKEEQWQKHRRDAESIIFSLRAELETKERDWRHHRCPSADPDSPMVHGLRERLLAAEEQLEMKEAEYSDQSERIAQLTHEMSALQGELSHKERQLAEYNRESHRSAVSDTLNERVSSLQADIDIKNSQLAAVLETDHAHITALLEQIHREVDVYQEEIATLKASSESTAEEMNFLRNELEQHTKTILILESKWKEESTVRQVTEEKERLIISEEYQEQLRAQRDDLEQHFLEDQKRWNKQVEELSNKLRAAEEKLKNVRTTGSDEMNNLEGRFSTEKLRYAERVDDLERQLREATETTGTVVNRNKKELARMQTEAEASLSHVQKELEAKNSIISQLEKRLQKLELDDLSNKNVMIETLKKKMADAELDHQNKREEFEFAKRKMREMEREREKRQEGLDQLMSRIRNLESDRDLKQRLLDEANTKLRNLENDRERASDAVDDWNKRYRRLEAERAKYQNEAEDYVRKMRRMEQDRERKQQIIDELTARLRDVELERHRRQGDVDEAMGTMRIVQEDFSAERKLFEDSKAKLLNHIKDRESAILMLSQQLHVILATNNVFKNPSSEQVDDKACKDFEEVKQRVLSKVQNLNAVISFYRTSLEKAEKENSRTRRELTDKLASKESQLKRIEEVARITKENTQNLEQRIKSLQKQHPNSHHHRSRESSPSSAKRRPQHADALESKVLGEEAVRNAETIAHFQKRVEDLQNLMKKSDKLLLIERTSAEQRVNELIQQKRNIEILYEKADYRARYMEAWKARHKKVCKRPDSPEGKPSHHSRPTHVS